MKRNIFQRLRRPESNKSVFTFAVTAIIFGMIIMSFVFMTPNGGGSLSGSATAATVGGKVIPILQLQQRTQQLEEQSRAFLPNGSDQFKQFFQSQALNELINAELLTEVRDDEGLYISDGLLAQTIMDIPAFQEKGKFQRDLYENYLANSGMSAGALEERIKKDLRLGIVRDLFSKAFVANNAEKTIYSQLLDFKIKMDYVDLSKASLVKNINPSTEDVKKALKDEKIQARAKALYEQQAFKYQSKDKIKAKWLLVVANGGSPEDFNIARKKLIDKTDKLTVENFSEIAKEISDDPTSKFGGDLGYVEKGTFDKAWDEVAFSLQPGEISAPFKVEQGWARLLVEEKKLGSKSGFEDVKMQVTKELLRSDQADLVVEKIKTAAGSSVQLNQIMGKLGLKWQSAPEFKLSSESIPGLGQADIIFEKILTLKTDGEIYPEVVSNEGKAYLIKRRQFDMDLDPNPEYQALSGQRQNYALGNWFEAQREKINVKINPMLNSNN